MLLPAGAIYWAWAHCVRSIREAGLQLRHRALHDPLTELPNRAHFFDHLDAALTKRARDGHQVAVLFIDLDRFKFVNDSLGHTAGDRLLTALARRLEQCVAPPNLVARVGGDEFAAVHTMWRTMRWRRASLPQ